MISATDLSTVKAIVFCVFMGMGGVDTISTVALSEMWGQRVQPWMQAKSALYAAGNVVPAILLQYFGFEVTQKVIALLCLSAVLGLAAEQAPDFAAFLFSCSSLSSSSDSSSSSSEAYMSKELSRVESFFHPNGDRKTGRSRASSVTSALDHDYDSSDNYCHVKTILDATEYCAVSEGDRNDPCYEPQISRTLSFATKDIARALRRRNSSASQLTLLDSHSRLDSFPKLRESTANTKNTTNTNANTASSFATATAATAEEEEEFPSSAEFETFGIFLIPRTVRNYLAAMMFVYLGTVSSIAGWLPTFVMARNLGGGDLAEGAFVASVFFFSSLVGSVASVPCSVYFSTSNLLRGHILLVLLGSVVCLFAGTSIAVLCLGTGVMGYGFSAIVALSLTVVNDYGYTM
jgi:hypothetical protein